MRGGATVVVVALAMLVGGPLWAVGPLTVGEIVEADLATPHPYLSSGSSEPMLTWSEQIVFPGATYVALHFSRMELGAGDFVVVHSPDGAQSWTYRGLGRHDLGSTPEGFFATHLNGDTAVVELWTQGETTGFGFAIDRYGRGYNEAEIADFWARGLGEEMNLPRPAADSDSPCTTEDYIEAKCVETSDPAIYDTSRAVARLLMNGTGNCTGWLVGDAGHLMTNEHCITSQAEMNNSDFEFMAEGPDCATNCHSSNGCPGVIEASGGTFVIDNSGLDYALVLPDTSTASGTNLPATYGFLRLRESGAVLGERVFHPQHPNTWGKQIMITSTYPEDVAAGGYCYASSLSEEPCAGSGYFDVGYWSDTDGGSSGSPVIAFDDHKVVALHHCRGSAFCSSGNPATDDRNRGVPIQLVVDDLITNNQLPPGALCDPVEAPLNLVASVPGDNQIDLVWDPVATAGLTYNVYRSQEACPGGVSELIASGLGTAAFSDTDVSGGITYAYHVTAEDPVNGCESDPTNCDDETATGVCTLAPIFDGIVDASSAGTDECGTTTSWDTATELCGSGVVYNLYRSETPGFTPDGTTLFASCLTDTTYEDGDVMSGTEYFYIARAEDQSGNGSGLCAGGNEDTNLVEDSAIPSGPDILFFESDFDTDDGGLVGTYDWEWGVFAYGAGCSSNVPPSAPHSGDKMWGTVLNDCYNNLGNNQGYDSCTSSSPADDSVLALDVDLSGTGSAQLCWWEWADLYLPWDPGMVWINGVQVHAICDSPIQQWTEVCVDMTPFAGATATVEFRMLASSVVNRAGWYIDDLRVWKGSPCSSGPLFADGFESGDTSAWSSATP